MRADVRSVHSSFAVFCTVLGFVGRAGALHVPGFTPRTYRDGDILPLIFSHAFSSNPIFQPAYTWKDLPFVFPPPMPHTEPTSSVPRSLAQIVRGDCIAVSYKPLIFGQDEGSVHLLTWDLSLDSLRRLAAFIEGGYRMEWRVDGLPGVRAWKGTDRASRYFEQGFALGKETVEMDVLGGKAMPRYELYNHVSILIRWRRLGKGTGGEQVIGEDRPTGRGKVIVGFEVFPKSVGLERGQKSRGGSELVRKKERGKPMVIWPLPDRKDGKEGEGLMIPLTYSVYWREVNNTVWRDRWDNYTTRDEESDRKLWTRIILLDVVIAFLATGGAIFAHAVRKDENKGEKGGAIRLSANPRSHIHVLKNEREGKKSYGPLIQVNDVDATSPSSSSENETESELPKGTLTRSTPSHSSYTPRTHPYASILPPLIGAGIQILSSTAIYTTLYAVHIINPPYYSLYVSMGFALWCSAAVHSGVVSSRLYRTYSGRSWRRNALVTSCLFPGVVSTFSHVLNLNVWWQTGGSFVPLGRLIAIGVLWVGLQGGLVYLGSWLGFRYVGTYRFRVKMEVGTRMASASNFTIGATDRIEREIFGKVLLAGLVPFVVLWMAMSFTFRNSEVEMESAITGVLGIVVVGLLVAVVVIEVVLVGMWSGEEETRDWPLYAFALGSASSPYVYLYLVYSFFGSPLRAKGFVPCVLFLAYIALGCVGWAMMCGALGFLGGSRKYGEESSEQARGGGRIGKDD